MSRLTDDLKPDSLPYAYKEMRNEGTEQSDIHYRRDRLDQCL